MSQIVVYNCYIAAIGLLWLQALYKVYMATRSDQVMTVDLYVITNRGVTMTAAAAAT